METLIVMNIKNPAVDEEVQLQCPIRKANPLIGEWQSNGTCIYRTLI